jgi:hypothetical protein
MCVTPSSNWDFEKGVAVSPETIFTISEIRLDLTNKFSRWLVSESFLRVTQKAPPNNH